MTNMPDDLAGLADEIRAKLRARRGDGSELVLMNEQGERRVIARGAVAAFLRCMKLGTEERYTIEWAGWSRPFSMRVTRWEGDGAIWQSTGAGLAFAPTFYVRLWIARWRQRRALPRARVVVSR